MRVWHANDELKEVFQSYCIVINAMLKYQYSEEELLSNKHKAAEKILLEAQQKVLEMLPDQAGEM